MRITRFLLCISILLLTSKAHSAFTDTSKTVLPNEALRAALRDIGRLKGIEAAYVYIDSALQSAQRGRRQTDSLLANCQASAVLRGEQVDDLRVALALQKKTTEAYISDLQSAKAELSRRKVSRLWGLAKAFIIGAGAGFVAALLLK